ncbi:MAG TPA: tRNA (adenosine(37)-N6)-threonylcarbamoyltransferase complex ATPase subunit type 1 TsaE [Candidatus Aphodoplasma excrementigallinarum]|uniref:tRNA threonylcarbamoyladenosine biosynthesis protein TsaE n=1 Tax=Candidatus Aphodoplasma excrementigallinarum TaxID=2840673 RepID=A0A9D1NH95_9FIRM|nr:tRNA (adenosine(37)-N6)-threonylcarbamoyltransferase complex ATPase subunit type 1 TsaE [Candidatus Aphodoplasma excrementigallinarum]
MVKQLEHYQSNSREETVTIAENFAKTLQKGDIVCLYGGLGAGKTAFVSGVAKGLGYQGYTSSPTFTLMNEYIAALPIYHFDVYRIAGSDEMEAVGIDDYLFGDGVCLIEWPDKIADLLPEAVIRVEILKSSTDENQRTITIERERGS